MCINIKYFDSLIREPKKQFARSESEKSNSEKIQKSIVCTNSNLQPTSVSKNHKFDKSDDIEDDYEQDFDDLDSDDKIFRKKSIHEVPKPFEISNKTSIEDKTKQFKPIVANPLPANKKDIGAKTFDKPKNNLGFSAKPQATGVEKKPLNFFDQRAKPVKETNDKKFEFSDEVSDYHDDFEVSNEAKSHVEKKSNPPRKEIKKLEEPIPVIEKMSPDSVAKKFNTNNQPNFLKKVEKKVEEQKVAEPLGKSKCLFLTDANEEDFDDQESVLRISKPTPRMKPIANPVVKNVKKPIVKPKAKPKSKPRPRYSKPEPQADLGVIETLKKENQKLLEQIQNLAEQVDEKMGEFRKNRQSASVPGPLKNERVQMKKDAMDDRVKKMKHIK